MLGSTAVEIASAVRGGTSPVDVARAHLDRAGELDARLGAFTVVRRERALAEAEALAQRSDLTQLPLAGVPIVIKDNIPVEGEPCRNGSLAGPGEPAPADHELVRRLRDAGAIVIAITRMPELAIWPMTDSPAVTTRNPWNTKRTTGGSSGGSAASVSAGIVPVAHANDGGGSIRIPAAACGLFGIKPGTGVVPSFAPEHSWHTMAENGPLATTVDDAALFLSVVAGRPELASVTEPASLRIAVSTKSTSPISPVSKPWKEAAHGCGSVLEQAGHAVARAEAPYTMAASNWFLYNWFNGVALDAQTYDRSKLEKRSRGHARAGKLFAKRAKPEHRDRWRARLMKFFESYDLLVTPTLARTPPKADGWSERGWAANMRISAAYAPMCNPWNLSGFPAASVPFGIGADGMPLAVQLVAPDGGEALILSVAKQLERRKPWPRHAPAFA